MDEQLVRLVQLLQRHVELLDDRGPVVAGELLVGLADQVVDDVVRSLNVHLPNNQSFTDKKPVSEE